MARQVLPIVGAAVGFVVGGPVGAQIGFALGSLVGNAVDPIEMQGRKLGDAPTQVAAEGGARAIVYGKGCIRATCILERGGRRVIKQRDGSGGKGGGPTTVNERALWTFAIGLGEPVAAILRIWENEKLVYDVTPDSAIQEDSAQFAEKFRFYTGAETQLPDPALEALHGAGNAPYYRGTAYLVFPQYDLTDFGEAVPTYRVEVATAGQSAGNPVIAYGYMDAAFGVPKVTVSLDGIDWDRPLIDAPGVDIQSAPYLAAIGERFIAWGLNYAWISDDIGASWQQASDALGGSGGIRGGAVDGGMTVVISGGVADASRSDDAGDSYFTWVGSPDLNQVAFLGGVLGGTRDATGQAYRYAGAWLGPFNSGVYAANGRRRLVSNGQIFRLAGVDSLAPGGLPICKRSTNMEVWTDDSVPFVGLSEPSCMAYGEIGGDSIWVLATFDGNIYYKKNNDAFVKADDTFGATAQDVVFNGSVFVMAGGESVGVSNGVVKTSTDGNIWTTRANNMGQYIRTLATQPVYSTTTTGAPVSLSSVLTALHLRAGHMPTDIDVTQATDMLSGVVIEQTVSGAEAINSIIGTHFIDPSDFDGKIRYIPRGAAVVLTLSEDDLIDEPDEAQRNNAIEYPRKVNFLGQRADLAYASSKSTSARYSNDAKVVGEITIGSPETYDDPTAPAEVAVKLHKVIWTEAEGEREWQIPDNYLALVPTDPVGLSYRGELVRCRIINIEDAPGQRKLRMIRDRQSAYTANLTEIPSPPAPTPPQSSVVAPTVMAFIDTSALTDSADSLHYLVALSGSNENWAGAVLQQQLSGNFASIDSTTLNSIIGLTQEPVSDASPYYTDTTNTVVVQLYTDDELESSTQAQFLSNGGAFFLSWESSGQTHWEIMQFRDAEQLPGGGWSLSHLMRGRKNTETAEHPVGSTFVFIDPSILREAAQTSWLNTELTHRAVSNGQSPELAAPQTNEYTGNSQREWPVADLSLGRPTADSVLAEAIPRHRFGSSMNPIRSINWIGYRWTATDGSNAITRDGTGDAETFDTTGWASPVTVTVAQLNRLTGAGPAVSEEIV